MGERPREWDRGHDALPAFSAVMEAFVLPLTAITLAVVGYRAWRERRRRSRSSPMLGPVAHFAAGLPLLAVGARWLVAASVAFARVLGVSELVIGLTFVAGAPSLPEVAASLAAAWRGERDIAVGNAVGSNSVNLVAVLGVTAVAAPGGVPSRMPRSASTCR